MGLACHHVDLIVVMVGVVVKQRQTLHPTLAGDFDRILVRTMTPMAAFALLGDRELGVVDQQISALDQVQHLAGNVLVGVLTRTMVGNECNHDTVGLDAITKGRIGMAHPAGRHRRAGKLELTRVEIVKADRAPEL